MLLHISNKIELTVKLKGINEMDNIIRRIPGEIPPQPKESKQGFIDDLSKKEKFELVDLLARQNKLLSNK